MAQNVVTLVAAQAELADIDEALQRARHTDDTDSEDLRSQVEAGEVLPLRLHVSVSAVDRNGETFTVDCVNEDVWVDRPAHPPELADAVREIAPKDFGPLSSDLRERGVEVTASDLAGMYVTVTLDESLQRTVLEHAESAAR